MDNGRELNRIAILCKASRNLTVKYNIVSEFFHVRREVRWYPWRPNDMETTVIPMYSFSLSLSLSPYIYINIFSGSVCFSLNFLYHCFIMFITGMPLADFSILL